MNTIAEYKCVFGYTTKELNTEIADLISGGWQPLGGVAVATYTVQEDGVLDPGTWKIFTQAMVRYETAH